MSNENIDKLIEGVRKNIDERSMGLSREAWERLEGLVLRKELNHAKQLIKTIFDDLRSDGFESRDVRDYLIEKLFRESGI